MLPIDLFKRMRIIAASIIFFTTIVFSFAQESEGSLIFSSVLTPETCVNSTDYSATSNPAAVINHLPVSGYIFYENRYNLPSLSVKGFASSYRTKLGVFQVGINRLGDKRFATSRYNFGLARRFGPVFSCSVRFNYFSHTMVGEREVGTLFSEVGILCDIKKNWVLGIHIVNPEGAKIDYTYYSEKLSSLYSVGIAYKLLNVAKVYSEFEITNSNTYLFGGLNIEMCRGLQMQGRMSFVNPVQFLGLAYLQKSLVCHVGFHHTLPLGWVSSVGLGIQFNN